MNELINIDVDLITELKFQGKHREANKLLTEFKINKNKNKKQLTRELRSQNDKKKRIYSIRNKICTCKNCNNNVIKGKMCNSCKTKARSWKKCQNI